MPFFVPLFCWLSALCSVCEVVAGSIIVPFFVPLFSAVSASFCPFSVIVPFFVAIIVPFFVSVFSPASLLPFTAEPLTALFFVSFFVPLFVPFFVPLPVFCSNW